MNPSFISKKKFVATVVVLLLSVVAVRPVVPPEAGGRDLQQTYFISTCGMELKSVFDLPQFFVFAVPALLQAFFAKGNVRARYLPFAGFSLTSHRTLSAWETEEDLMAFVNGGAHARAVESIPRFASLARALRMESATIPSFAEILPVWEEEAVTVFGGEGVGRHF